MLACRQLELGSIFRSFGLESRLGTTLSRVRRGVEITEDFAGASLLAAHDFLSDASAMAQSVLVCLGGPLTITGLLGRA